MAHNVDWQELSQELLPHRRDGRRLAISYSVAVTGIGRDRRPFSDETQTTDISEDGCCFVSPRPLELGDVITLSVNRTNDVGPQRFQIVWTQRVEDRWNVGAKLIQQRNLWGIAFPPKHDLRKDP